MAYEQPLFVYIPPFSELRGGAWVVVDSTINADSMEFYAAEDARGGVLEATGAVSIKFREKDLKASAHRLDSELISMDARLVDLKSAESQNAPEIAELTRQITHRERMLLGVYQQVAVHFGDLHDTPGRMKRKGVIRKQVNWVESRTFFFWRLRRRLAELDISKKMNANDTSSKKNNKLAAAGKIKSWYLESGAPIEKWDGDDRFVVQWLAENEALVQSKVQAAKTAAIASAMSRNLQHLDSELSDDDIAETLHTALLSGLSEEKVRRVLAAMQKSL